MSEPTTQSYTPALPACEVLEVSVVMPCLNEAETLATCIKEAMLALVESRIEGEVVIADNGSTDGSQEIAELLGARVVDVAEKGYGNALRGGIEASRGQFIVMGDSDASYDFGHLPRFVDKLRDGHDLVMGNRFQGGIEPGAMPWKHRFIGNPVLSGIGRLFFHCPAGDFHCGLRGFSKEAYERMELSTAGMEFASEMVITATLKGMRIAEVPTVLRPDGRSHPPHLRSWRDGWRHLRFMLLYCPRWLFLVVGLSLLLSGLMMVMAIAVSGRLTVAGIGMSVNTSMAAAMLTILGCQLVLVGVFARQFATAIGTHPPSPMLARLSQYLSLEHGMVAGGLVALVGLAFLTSAFAIWQETGFGQLDAILTVRRVIPAVLLCVVGIQTIFGSFFLSLLSLIPKQNRQPPAC